MLLYGEKICGKAGILIEGREIYVGKIKIYKFKVGINRMRRVLKLGSIILSASLLFNLVFGPIGGMEKVYYDVAVIGGDPEGVAAAVASARNGAKTVLIEHRDGLGGLLTYGMLNQLDLGYDKDRQVANQGIFKEWHKMVGSSGTFDIEQGKEAFLKLVENEENLTLSLETRVLDVIKKSNIVTGIIVETKEGKKVIRAKRFIDATADADFAALTGVPYFVGQEDIGLKDTKMAVTLVIVLEGVDWDKLKESAGQNIIGGYRVNGNMAWGFPDMKKVYKPTETNTLLRGLNIGEQKDGTVTINALQIFGIDGLDEQSKQTAFEKGKRETQHVVEFLRKNIPGFENAEIARYPDELYIRETRHILAEYQLPITDVWENKDHWDSIGIGAYPVDVQQTTVDGWGYYITNPVQYAIPYRSLVPKEIEGLLVASKASGYSSLTAGSARTVPIGMTAGQAAGTAAALSVFNSTGFREMIKEKELITELQDTLKEQGALLYLFELSYPYQGEWFYPAIKRLMPLGIINAGYDNNLRVNEPMAERDFLKLLADILIRSNPEKYREVRDNYFSPWEVAMATDYSIDLTRDKASQILLALFGYDNYLEGIIDPWEAVIELGLVDDEIASRLKENRKVLRSEGFHIVAHLLQDSNLAGTGR